MGDNRLEPLVLSDAERRTLHGRGHQPEVGVVSISDGTAAMASIDWAAAITALAGGQLPCSPER